MGSALLDNSSETSRMAGAPPGIFRAAASLPEASNIDLRRHAAERLAAHRSRRGIGAPSQADATSSLAPRNKRSARIASAVAERYAHTQSYRDFLAAEAERAVQQACAAAEVAERNAQALAAAHQALLGGDAADLALPEGEAAQSDGAWAEQGLTATPAIETGQEQAPAARSLWPELETAAAQPGESARRFHPPGARAKQARQPRRPTEPGAPAPAAHQFPVPPDASVSAEMLAAGITIRLYQDESGTTRMALDPAAAAPIGFPGAARPRQEASGLDLEEEARLLDEEIAFRHQPEFEPTGPPEPLPANLIEFPRQLVAARKARPRLAEGPLREETVDAPGAGQLRIFEVEPEQIATTAPSHTATEVDSSAQWTTIWLDSQPEQLPEDATGVRAAASGAAARRAMGSLLNVASVGRRVLAASVNAAILAGVFAVFTAAALWLVGHLPGPGALPLSMGAEAESFLSRGAIEAALPFAAGAFLLLAAIYQALFFSFSTATPGMRAARIALCTFSDENPSRAAVRRRLLALLLSAVPMGLGFLWATLDEERLSWHDRICGIYQRSY